MVTNQDVLARALDCWNRDDLPGYLELYGDDVVMHGYAGLEPGFANVRRFYEEWWRSFPGSRLTLQDVITSKDKVVCRFVIDATHGGSFQGLPPTGKRISVAGITILRFVHGKCVERWTQLDSLGLLLQIGALGPRQ